MIYAAPPLGDIDESVLAMIGALREDLRFFLHEPRRWTGSLRRAEFARAARGSLSIEGYHTSVESAAAIIDGEEPAEVSDETRHAIAGYREAMTCVLQLAPGAPDINVSLLLSLHFMMMRYDFSKHPGRWRPGAVWVTSSNGEVVYEAPDRELVEPLVDEALAQIAHSEGPAPVTAAMAHLNLTLIHPFSDGNGRMARCLQTLVLAAASEGASEFVSIEEYLGANTAAYYAVLTEVARGTWSPQNSALPWIRFCLTAHYRQARTVLRRIRELEALWDACEQIARRHRLAPRTVGALVDAARGWRLRRSLYVAITKATAGETISGAVATSDLAAMARAGLLNPVGEKRGRFYAPTEELTNPWQGIRSQRPPADADNPYEIARAGPLAEPRLPGLG
ncbi:MAG: Fic family protein [Acidimicrobiaceae bacterium]|nr:Fic family protein [Acidimicrobiaceae bacterium]